MKNLIRHFSAIFASSLIALISVSVSVSGQTLSLNDGTVIQSKTNRIGVNIGSINYWDSGQMLKNLIGSINPGFEPLLSQQIWVLGVAGTTTTFTEDDKYDNAPANYWTGATFTVVESQSGGAELGCTGTIASNAAGASPLFTVSSPCSGAFSVGDIITISKATFPTPESWWESSQGGMWGSISGGGQLLSDTTDLCATCGTQSLNLNASATGSAATAAFYFDSGYSNDLFVLMNGTYQLSFWAKAASGTPTLTVLASRLSTGGFNCGSYTPKLTSTWTQYNFTCTASEAPSTTPGTAQVKFNSVGGAVYLDNVDFEKTSSSINNPTVMRDEVIQTLQNYYGPAASGPPGMFRYWLDQNGETMANWTQPDYAHAPTVGGTGYYVAPSGGGLTFLSLEDYLVICQFLGADPYLEVPVTFTPSDAANLIEFLASPSNTTYGARRAALGQADPWTDVFDKIHLSYCNECWNGVFAGQNLPWRSSGPNTEFYYDYGSRAKDIFAAMHADSYYSAPSFDLILNAQTATSWSMDTTIQKVRPDSIEINDYLYETVNDTSSDAALWQPAMVEPWERVNDASDPYNFYQSVHDYQSQKTCGASGTAACNVNIYEWGQSTLTGNFSQAQLDTINVGAGQGVVLALEPLLNLQYYGILPQSLFSLAQYQYNNGASNGHTAKLWGSVVDMGGATNNMRPAFLGVSLVNQSIIGPMYSCPINNNVTYNFAGSVNGSNPIPAFSNVPSLYAFCFENGSARSVVLINTDLTASHTISFAGTNPPAGAVTQRQYAPASLDDMNEAHTGTASNQTAATVAIETSSLSSPGSITLPPHSVTALDYTTGGQAAAAEPTFTPAGGTYTASQTVTINDATSGATIYYTTDGTTPTTSSAVYSSPITVSATETLSAIAVETGYANSAVASALYTISAGALPTPTFSPAAGTYTSSQTVSISDATAGATIYYTTNGTAPTTSSAVYSGQITVSAKETLEAIAVETGYTNSAVASALYTISAGALPTPTFSPAAGTYTSSQTVSISDATAGATIYYTTNGTAPTTSSAVYSGQITVSATETLEAIAVETGYTNSAVASAAYTINTTLPAPTITPAGGSYSTSQSVTIGDSISGSTIYYTTDGTTPTTSSNKYSGTIKVNSSVTLTAIAAMTGHKDSPAAAAKFTIGPTLPTPTFSPAAGSYPTSQSVTISDSTAGTTIYFTTNGKTPTTSSTVYNGPITVSATETLEAIAVEAGYSNSPAASANYSIGSTSSTKKTPKLKVTPSSSQVSTTEPLAVAVAVSGDTGEPTPTGTVVVTSDSYSSPATELSNGNATINIPAGKLKPGKHTLTVSYTPDGASAAICNSASTAVPVTVAVAAYTLAATGVTVAPGASATSTVTVSTTTDFAGTVTLSCAVTSSPADATDLPTCTTSKAVKLDSNKTSETTTVAVDTTQSSSAQMLPKPASNKGWGGAGQGAVLALLVFLGIPARRRKWQAMLCALIMVAAMGGLVGCGGLVTNPSVSGAQKKTPGTTAGTYTITVTGTGDDSLQTTATTTFTVTVN